MGTPKGPYLETFLNKNGEVAVRPVIWNNHHVTPLEDYIQELQGFSSYAEECNRRLSEQRLKGRGELWEPPK